MNSFVIIAFLWLWLCPSSFSYFYDFLLFAMALLPPLLWYTIKWWHLQTVHRNLFKKKYIEWVEQRKKKKIKPKTEKLIKLFQFFTLDWRNDWKKGEKWNFIWILRINQTRIDKTRWKLHRYNINFKIGSLR